MSYLAKRARITDTNNCINGVIDDREKRVLHFAEYYLSPQFSDVAFVIDSDSIPGHRVILAVNGKWQRIITGNARIEFSGMSVEAFKELIRYIYTGVMTVEEFDSQLLSDVRQLSEEFEMHELTIQLREFESMRAKRVTTDSVVSLLSASDDSHQTNACIKFIAENANDILCRDDFYDLPPPLIIAVLSRDTITATEPVVFESVKRWINGNPGNSVVAKQVFRTCRLELLPYEFLWTNVRKFITDRRHLLTIDELNGICAAKAQMMALNAEIRDRAYCVADCDLITFRNTARDRLAQIVRRGKVDTVGEENAHIELDLGIHCLINVLAVQFSPQSKCRYAFRVQTSRDGHQWKDLFDFRKYHTSNKLDLLFEPRVVRHIRITDVLCYTDWNTLRKDQKETKQMKRISGLWCQYEKPAGDIQVRDNILASQFVVSTMVCDLTYKSWYKRNGRNFYVCSLNDPIVVMLQQPVWMQQLSLFLPDDNEREFNFTVEVTADPIATVKEKRGWMMIADFREETRRGDVQISFPQSTIVNVIRITGTRVVNPVKGTAGKEFSCEIRL